VTRTMSDGVGARLSQEVVRAQVGVWPSSENKREKERGDKREGCTTFIYRVKPALFFGVLGQGHRK
jgi:hypothetical protein